MSDMPMNHSINHFDACFTAKSLRVYSVGLQIDDEHGDNKVFLYIPPIKSILKRIKSNFHHHICTNQLNPIVPDRLRVNPSTSELWLKPLNKVPVCQTHKSPYKT